MDFARPIVVVSECLELLACRYNGASIRAPIVTQLAAHVDLRPVCPEVAIGLGVPREPIRIVTRGGRPKLVQPATGRDITEPMNAFSAAFLASLDEVDGFILKSRSPSCGIKDTKIYGEKDAGPIGKDAGFFGKAVLHRFPDVAVEDEGRLTNRRLRQHFLTRIFLWADWRRARKAGRMQALMDFHTRNKFLLMAYNQSATSRMGRVLGQRTRGAAESAAAAYGDELARAVRHPPKLSSTINAVSHAFGYFKAVLSAAEKRHFLSAVEQYRQGRVEFAALLTLLNSWVARTTEPYLSQQTLFAPYPPALVDLADSGR